MAQQIIDTTTPQPGGKTGEPIPTSFGKANANFTELYGQMVSEQALATDYYGATEPDPTWPAMVWADSANAVRKIRNAADDGWITLGPLFTPLGDAAYASLDALLTKSGNLSGLANLGASRTNLGLGSAAIRNAIGAGDLYSRGGIVGSVSQSGGVPTGAAFQYIPVTGGGALRNAAGLQICWGTVGGYADTAADSLFSDNSDRPIVFAAQFSSTPALVTSTSRFRTWAYAGSVTFSGGTITMMASFSSGSVGQSLYIAVGRWYN